MSGVPTDLSAWRAARSNMPDGTTNVACPECGNEWLRTPAVIIDADAAGVVGYAHPLTCIECGHSITGEPEPRTPLTAAPTTEATS